MIPELVKIGNNAPWDVLPPGIHQSSLLEIENKYSYTPHRRRLFLGFSEAARNLHIAGCRLIYLDGSYVTSKPHPNDFDAIWDLGGVDPSKLDPVLLDFSNKRGAQKAKYGGELFISNRHAMPGVPYLDFFQQDRYAGSRKGILLIDLSKGN